VKQTRNSWLSVRNRNIGYLQGISNLCFCNTTVSSILNLGLWLREVLLPLVATVSDEHLQCWSRRNRPTSENATKWPPHSCVRKCIDGMCNLCLANCNRECAYADENVFLAEALDVFRPTTTAPRGRSSHLAIVGGKLNVCMYVWMDGWWGVNLEGL
jgi:hypothetical protein